MKLKAGTYHGGALLLAITFSGAALAAEDDAGSQKSVDEIAIEMMNPISSLFPVSNDFIYQPFQGTLPGGNDQTQTSWVISGAFPILLSNGKNLVLRASIPVNLAQPTYAFYDPDYQEYIDWRIRQEADTIPRDGSFYDVHGHMYDIDYDVAYGGVNENGLLTMIGIAGTLPTSQDGSGERDQYLLGPEFALGKIADWGIIGGWLSHRTNVANVNSDTNYDTNLTSLKIFFGYGLGNGWQIVSNPEIVYDWEGADNNKLLLPLGGGVAKTVKFGSVPVKFSLEAYAFVQSPDAFGPDWNLTFRVIPVAMDRSR